MRRMTPLIHAIAYRVIAETNFKQNDVILYSRRNVLLEINP